jgi:RHS repeat-associated protein
VRGKIDPDDSWGYWILRAAFYDASGTYLGYQDAEMGNGSSISETWQKKGGNVTVPANATQMRLQLYNYMNTGWVAFDDVALTTLVDVSATTIRRVTYSTSASSAQALAGQAIAVRVTGDPDPANNGLFYLHSDHLGSTSAMSNSSGQLVGEVARYTPYGDYRSGGPNAITDRGFTGQKENMELGLYYYNARYYVPGIGRFASADTIVPNPANPQSLNRYSYVRNSPLNFTDPTGHRDCEFDGNCGPPQPSKRPSSPSPGDPLKDFYDSGYDYNPDPERTRKGYHNGVDLGNDSDTPNDVWAIATGRVRVADNCTVCRGGGRSAEANFGVGNVVIIEYIYDVIPANIREAFGLVKGDSVYIQYQHLESIDESITVGKEVQLGDTVGQYGNTGLSDGDHLHLEIHIGRAGALGRGTKDGTYDTHSKAWHELSIVDPNLIWNIPPPPH